MVRRRKQDVKPPAEAEASSPPAETEPAPAPPSPSTATGLSQPQFSAIICLTIAMTHCLDAYRSVQGGTENSTYCSRHFVYPDADVNANADVPIPSMDMDDPDSIPNKCNEIDTALLTLKYQTMTLRIVLYLIASIICWTKESLLKSFNYASGMSLLTTILTLHYQKTQGNLRALEIYSLVALAVLTFISNREGRQGLYPTQVKEGLYNIVLLLFASGMSWVISQHGMAEPSTFLSLTGNEDGDIEMSKGALGQWYMIILAEYTSIMFVAIFAFLFFDPMRKRILLVFMAILMIVHALYQLPLQKELWLDASGRQGCAMGIFVALIVGALVPPFDHFVVKR